jgi:3-oxoadipate enol-lactonase
LTTLNWPTSLRELELFADCSDEELAAAGSFMTRTEIPAGADFIREGRLGREAMVIADGVARVTSAGREVAAVGRGDVVGEMALLSGQPRSATVTAVTPIAAYVCTPAELTALRAVAPSVDQAISRVAGERCRTNRQLGVPGGGRRPRPGRLVRWRAVELPGRGSTFACDLPGPTPDAPAVILLHGLSATGALNWGPSLTTLNDQFRVVALDHRGHGRGITAAQPFTLEDCADDAVALADVLGIERAVFVGYSMGGPIAQLVWRRHPDRVRGLVLCATAADFRMSADRRAVVRALEGVQRTSYLIPRPMLVQSARAVLAGFVVDAELKRELLDSLSRHDDAAVREAGRAIRSFSSTDWVGEVSVPTAVVVTERDHLVPVDRQRGLAHQIPEAKVVRLDGNHMVFLTQPQALADAVHEACRLVSAEPSREDLTPVRRRWRSLRRTRSRSSRRRSLRPSRGTPRRREGFGRYQVRRCSGTLSASGPSGVNSQRALQVRLANRQPAGVRTTTSS